MHRLPTLAFFFLIGCGAQQQPTGGLSDSDDEAIRQLLQDLGTAGETGEHRSLGRFFTEDAVWMPQDQPDVEGRDAIQAWFGVGALDWEHQVLEVNGTQDLAYVRATAALHLDIDGVTPFTTKVLAVMRRQGDGSWLISHYSQSCSSDCQ